MPENLSPDWLPELIPLSSWNTGTYDFLYEIFQEDIFRASIFYRGKKVVVPPEIEDGKERIFWHLTTKKDDQTGDRIPDLKRAKRMKWVKSMIEQTGKNTDILDWDYSESKDIRTYITLKTFNYVVILKKLKNHNRILITAFNVEDKHYKEKLRKKYEGRIKRPT